MLRFNLDIKHFRGCSLGERNLHVHVVDLLRPVVLGRLGTVIGANTLVNLDIGADLLRFLLWDLLHLDRRALFFLFYFLFDHLIAFSYLGGFLFRWSDASFLCSLCPFTGLFPPLSEGLSLRWMDLLVLNLILFEVIVYL